MSENGNGHKPKLSLAEFEARPFVELRVETLGSDDSFTMFMKDQDPKTDRDFQRIATHNNTRTKLKDRDLEAAMAMIFDRKFDHIDVDISEILEAKGYDSEKQYFLEDETGKRYMRSAVNAYMSIVRAQVEASKE